MGLTETLGKALDSRQRGSDFLSSVAAPAGQLHAISAPATDDRLRAIVAGTANLDLTAVAASIRAATERAQPIVASLPLPADVLGTLNDVIERVKDIAGQNVASDVDALLAKLRTEMEAPPEGGRFALLIRLLDVLSNAPEAKIFRDLLTTAAHGAGVELPGTAPYLAGLQALDALARALGGMMSLESVLGEAERLSRAMASMAAPGLVASRLAAIDAALGGAGSGVADFVSNVAADDSGAVAEAVDVVVAVASRLDALQEELAAALGMGEATLVYLDMARLQRDVDRARTMMRTADLAHLRRLAAKVAPALQPFVALDLSALPPSQIGALLARLEGEIATIAAGIQAFDPAMFVTPLTDVIGTITEPLRQTNQLVAGATASLRSALEQVRDAVAALPFQNVADAVRAVLDPINQVLHSIRALVADIQTALNAAGHSAIGALQQIDGALNTFQKELDKDFAAAKQVVDDAHLDQILGQVAESVQAFADLLKQADMQPYFDNAVGAIHTTTNVVSAVPFNLLPASMKADVDAVVKPVKAIDADAVAHVIENDLGIQTDGTLAISGDIDAAKAEVSAKYKALLDAIDASDPRTLLANVDAELKAIADQIQKISPVLTLQPVTDAIDSVKRVVHDIDLDHALEPVRVAFAQIDAALDSYTSTPLFAPLEQSITEARNAVIAQLRLDKWKPALDDVQTRAAALFELVSPERVRALLEDALAELNALLQTFPEADTTRAFGTVVAGLLVTTGLRVDPSSFPVVAGWIGGASGNAALAAHTAAIADAFAAAREAAEGLDLQTAAAPLIARMTALRTAVQNLKDGLDRQSPAAVRLAGLLPRLDAAARLGALADNAARYRATLARAADAVDSLRRQGFSEVDDKAGDFRAALEPLRPAWEQLQAIFAAMGIDPAHLSVTGIVQALLREAPPERLANLLMRLLDALRDRLSVVLTAVIAPLKAAVDDLTTLLNAIDLAPLSEAADGIVQEVKKQIDLLSPGELLREPLASFTTLQQNLFDADPLGPVIATLNALRDTIAAVLKKLSLEELLKTPLAIYDEIRQTLGKLDPSTLLDPVIADVAAIGHEVDAGLDETVEAFKQLQAALPAVA